MEYSLIKHITTLSSHRDIDGEKWTNELNIVSWNHTPPVFDIREWNGRHSKCHVGIKLDADELDRLVEGYAIFKGEERSQR